MSKLEIEGDSLQITVEGVDKLWALKSHLTIPLKHIVSVSADAKEAREWWHGFRVAGAHVPGVIAAGTFFQSGKWVFWDVHDPERTIAIELEDESYQKLVIEVEDPLAEIRKIMRAVEEAK